MFKNTSHINFYGMIHMLIYVFTSKDNVFHMWIFNFHILYSGVEIVIKNWVCNTFSSFKVNLVKHCTSFANNNIYSCLFPYICFLLFLTWNWGFLEHSDFSLKCNIFQTYYRVGALLCINRRAQQLSSMYVDLCCNVDQPNKVGLILKCTDSVHRFNVQIGLSHIYVVWGLKYCM